MRFHWLRDPATKEELQVTWDPDKYNKVDYYTKHFPPKHHVHMRYGLFLLGLNTQYNYLHTPARNLQRTRKIFVDRYSDSKLQPLTGRTPTIRQLYL